MVHSRSRNSHLIRLTAAVAAAATLPAMLVAISSQASADVPRPAGIPHAAAAAAALARARSTGRPVVVAPDTTPTSVTVANPDGTFTNTVNALPVRVLRHGTWVPASARLVRAHGALSPAAATEPVMLSAGGAGPMAQLRGPHGQNLTLWFPGRLPAPTISGATAIYRSVRPGIDLRLTATTTGGIAQTLVVHSAAAAASPWLREFTERYAASGGLRLRADRAGNVVAAGRSGVVFTAAAPAAFLPAQARGSARASAPGQPTAFGRVVVSGGRISEMFSGRALAHPTAFPLTVTVAIAPASGTAAVTAIRGPNGPDAFPSPSTLTPNGYVEAQDVQSSGGCQDAKNWNSTSVTALGIGFQAWSTCIGVYQTYYVFDTSSISTAWDILHVELNLLEIQGSWNNCGGPNNNQGVTQEPVYLHSLGANAGIGSGTDGANVSTLGTSSLVKQLWPATNPGKDTCSNQPADFDVTSLGNSIKGNHFWTFGVNGDDTDNPNAGQFMRLSDNPTLVTTFDEFPAAPTMAQSAPAMTDNPATTDTHFGCVTTSNPNPVIPWIGAAASAQLNANFTAPLASEEVEPGWKVWNASTTVVNQTNANTSPGSFPYTLSRPVDGDQYFSQIWTTVNGNGGQGGFDPGETTQGPECSFATDQTPPSMPAVTSSAFPPAGSGQGTTQVAPGASGTFSFTSSDPPPSGCTSSSPIAAADFSGTASTCLAGGVYEFEYSLNQPLSDGNVTPVTTCPAGGTASGAVAAVNSTGNPATSTSANPSATTTATSCQINISQWGTNILYVAAVDAAGNISQTFQYEFYVPWNTATPVKPGDINSDGQPDLLATDASGNLVFFPGGTDPANGPVIAGTAATSPQGDSWNDYVVAHRGTLSAGSTDDLLALNKTGGNLYRYNNSWNTNQWPTGVVASPTSPMYEVPSHIVTEFYPTCTAIPSGEGGAGSANCTGYPSAASGWSSFTQIIAPGDAWTGAPNGSGVIADTSQPSMLGVASNGSLWLFQGSGGQFTNPVQLGSTGWNNTTVMAAGTVNGVDTIWARINTGTDAGDIESFALTVPSGQVPTLNAAAPATLPAPTSGTILVDGSGSAIQVPAATFPTLTATGPLSGSACATTDTSGCPGFFAQDTSGDMFYYAGRPTTTAAGALGGTRELLGDVGGTDPGSAIPSTGTVQNASYPGDYCKLTNVQNGGGGWRINPDNTMSGFYLNEGASFALGSQVECWFANGMHEKLVLQGSDGNLVFYQYFTPKTWGATTAGQGAAVANFQTDGNFVVRTGSPNNTALWASGTHTYHNAVLVLQADGNLVIYPFPSPSAALWSTGTSDPSAG